MFMVSIILPVFNGEPWLNECLQSILQQTYDGPIELCIYNDCSSDNSVEIIEKWRHAFEKRNIFLKISTNKNNLGPSGCGYAKNRAVESSNGTYLCFVDADDILFPSRIECQINAATNLPNDTIIGSKVTRVPEHSTLRYTRWINSLNIAQLYTQRYTSHGPTVVMPTWFMHKSVYTNVGGFSEMGKGIPEDYIFFLKHLDLGGHLHRVNKTLIKYRHHPMATTYSVHKDTIWKIRLEALEKDVLAKWDHFTVWNAGKQGRKFYRDLSPEDKLKVEAFCDVDVKKIIKGKYIYEESPQIMKPTVPIINFQDARSPFIICVKMDLTNGEFEKNLASLNLNEGVDYYHFN